MLRAIVIPSELILWRLGENRNGLIPDKKISSVFWWRYLTIVSSLNIESVQHWFSRCLRIAAVRRCSSIAPPIVFSNTVISATTDCDKNDRIHNYPCFLKKSCAPKRGSTMAPKVQAMAKWRWGLVTGACLGTLGTPRPEDQELWGVPKWHLLFATKYQCIEYSLNNLWKTNS